MPLVKDIGMKLFMGGVKNGRFEKLIRLWAEDEQDALSQIEEIKKEHGLPDLPGKFIVKEVTNKSEIIEAQVELIDSLMEQVVTMEHYLEHREHIGSVGVDSGQLMIVDPGYISDKGIKDRVDMDEVYAATSSDEGCGQVLNDLAVTFSTAWGDGGYDVYAVRDEEGRIIKVEIDMSL